MPISGIADSLLKTHARATFLIREIISSTPPFIAFGRPQTRGFNHLQTCSTLKPFAGIIYCGHCNAPMFIATATKPNGRRYEYYVCHVDEKRAHRQCPLHRVPAEALEKLLLDRIAVLLKTPTMLANICKGELRDILDTKQAGEALDGLSTIWSAMFPVEKYNIIHSLIRRVLVFENEVRIMFHAKGIVELLKEAGLDFSISTENSGVECVLTVPSEYSEDADFLT